MKKYWVRAKVEENGEKDLPLNIGSDA